VWCWIRRRGVAAALARGSARALCPSRSAEARAAERTEKATLFGSTCDSLDVLARCVRLPRLCVGAYSTASGSRFNGFPLPEAVYVG
jgi:diaminopimelate decarboxylase